MNPPTLSQLIARCDAWNKAHPVGTEVKFHWVIGKPDHRVTRTRTAAYVLSQHTAVVFVEGVAGCVALDACVPTRRDA
jgi:hypothetical protein